MTARSTPVLFVAACALAFGAGWLARDVASSGEEDAAAPAESGAPSRGEAPSASARDRGRSSSMDTAVPRGRDSASGVPRSNSAAASRPTTAAEFESRIEAAWEAAHPDTPKPHADEFEFVARRARDLTEAEAKAAAEAADRNVKHQVHRLEQHAALQEKRGVAEDGPLTLELRARGRERVAGDESPGKLGTADFDPLDAGTRETEGAGVAGGVPRVGRAFVVDRVEIDARLGRDASQNGRIEVSWVGGRCDWSARSDRIRAVFEGTSKPLSLDELKLDVSDGVARVRFVGRIVAPDAAADARPFEWRADESVGFLRDGAPIRIQIVADHGGGNPRTVHLTGGTNGRFREISPRPVWDDSADLDALKRSTYWTESAGLLPPGFVFRLTRIDWRARLRGDTGSRGFDIKAPPGTALDQQQRELVSVVSRKDSTKDQSETFAGSWSGDRVINAGNVGDLEFTCHYFGMADITVFGRLERVKR